MLIEAEYVLATGTGFFALIIIIGVPVEHTRSAASDFPAVRILMVNGAENALRSSALVYHGCILLPTGVRGTTRLFLYSLSDSRLKKGTPHA